MSNYAYKDKNRTIILFADKAVEEDRNIRFFCPNKECNAELYICSVNGSKKAYFKAKKSKFGHIDGCKYKKSNKKFDKNNFNENDFKYDDAINNLCTKTKKYRATNKDIKYNNKGTNTHTLRTLRQIYLMCKSLSETERYAGRKASEMLFNNSGDCLGNKIVEGKRKKRIYKDKKEEIYLENQNYTFILKFYDTAVYKEIRNKIYNNKDNGNIVVAGNWNRYDEKEIFFTYIIGTKQIYIKQNRKPKKMRAKVSKKSN